MILSNIKQFLANKKKFFSYITIFFILSFLFGDVALATDVQSDSAQKVAEFVNAILKGVSLLLGLMTYLATVFLSPEWINGSLFGMNEKFKEVWIMVSNVVYFVFAFILIWIAFMNIIGKNADQYQLKQALPKFIVGVLIVPFSWFLVQFILSISAILTISALSLPIDSFPDYQNALKTINVPAKCVINLEAIKSGEKSGEFIDCPKEDVKNLNDIVGGSDSTNSIYAIISMYTYGIIGFDTVDTIDISDTGKMKSLGDILVKVVFDLLFVLVYAILIIALGMVLMIRGIYIWIYTMMSPIFGLMYFFDKKDSGGDGFFGKFNLGEFIALAMVPVYTMLALSFGLLFMYVVGSGLGQHTGGSQIANQSVKVEDGKISIGNGSEKFTLEIKGAVASRGVDATGYIKSIGGDALGIVGTLILKLFGIVVLWGTVMAAMNTSKVTGAIIKPLQDFGGKVGGIMTSAPGNIPIFGGQSMKSMEQIATTASSSFDTHSRDRGTEFLKKHNLFQNGQIELGNNSLNALNLLKKGLTKDSAKAYIKAYKTGKDGLELSKNPQFINATLEMAKELNLPKTEQKLIKTGMGVDDLSKILGKIDYELGNKHAGYNIDMIGNNEKNGATTRDIIDNDLKSNTSSNGSSIKKPTLDESGTNPVININKNKPKVEVDESGKVTKLLGAVDDLAKYISQNNLDTKSLNNLISSLNLSESAIKELSIYFKEDGGKIVYDRGGKGGVDVRKFAKEHDIEDK